MHIAPETIYSWLYYNVEGQRYIYLLQKANKKQRNKRKQRALKKAQKIKYRVSIHNRPNIDGMFGHFEADSIVSKYHSSGEAIHTEIEKKKRRTKNTGRSHYKIKNRVSI